MIYRKFSCEFLFLYEIKFIERNVYISRSGAWKQSIPKSPLILPLDYTVRYLSGKQIYFVLRMQDRLDKKDRTNYFVLLCFFIKFFVMISLNADVMFYYYSLLNT